MVHFADVTFGIKLSRNKKRTEKEETLKDIIQSSDLSEATSHLKHNIHKLRNSSSALSQFAVSSLPKSITSLAPGCQNPRGFVYIIFTMVIKHLNENPNFFDHFFDPFSMSDNKGTSIFQRLPEEVLVCLMNLVAEAAGLSNRYFNNHKEIKNHALEFKTFLSEVQTSPNPYKNLWEYEQVFKDEGLYESIRQFDDTRQRRLAYETAKEKHDHFVLFLKKYANEINTHQNPVDSRKYTRGFIYRIMTLAFVHRNKNLTAQEKEASDRVIQIAHLKKEENKEILLLMNNAAVLAGLGEQYFLSFKDIEEYCNEFISFYFYNVTKLQGDYQFCSDFVKQFIEQASYFVQPTMMSTTAVCANENTVSLITRRCVSSANTQANFLEHNPARQPAPSAAVFQCESSVETQDPGYIMLIKRTHWFFHRQLRALSLFIQDRKKMKLTTQRVLSDFQRIAAYLIAILLPVFIQVIGWVTLENLAKGRKS